MKLTLRPEWRLRPLSSFLGCLDIKTGVVISILFAVRHVSYPGLAHALSRRCSF